jgi:cob(I)alamin adenosyltransferase
MHVAMARRRAAQAALPRRTSIWDGDSTMGKRLTKIATRTGDDGTTGLGDGSRVGKTDTRIVAVGEVDELNSHMGVLLCEPLPEAVRAAVAAVQHDLFDLGGELATPGYVLLADERVERLDAWLAQWNADLPPLAEFILPGGVRAAALAHVCRTVCRRAERAVVALAVAGGDVRATPRLYLNRLSDLLFVATRVINREAGQPEALWRRDGRE